MNLYFDNASTSWPKPPEVYHAVKEIMENLQGNPSRSAGGNSARLVFQTREMLAKFFNIRNSTHVIFTFNATTALNLCIQGYVEDGWRVITTSMEHNAVLRPLNALEKYRNVVIDMVKCSPEGFVDPDDLRKKLQKPAHLLIVNHASNVTGTLQDLEPLGCIAKEHQIAFLVDCSQSAGVVEIDVERDHIDMLACPGHKSLLGPTGTGVCYLNPSLVVRPIVYGGTGSLSERECMPEDPPDRYEAGTMNFHGIAGLRASLQYIMDRGIHDIHAKEKTMIGRCLEKLSAIDGIHLHGPTDPDRRLPVFSITLPGVDPALIGDYLSSSFGITTRIGLHCAPWAHRTIGTYPQGTVRISPGLFHTGDDIDTMADCLRKTVEHFR